MSIKSVLPFLFIIFSTNLVAKDLFWIGNSGEWTNRANWSLKSGGLPANVLPEASDDVIFDEHSFDQKNQTVTFDKVSAKSITVKSAKTPYFSGGTLTLTEGLDFFTKLMFNADLEFEAKGNERHTINTGGFEIYSNVRIVSGKWQLGNNIVLDQRYDLFIKSNEFYTNNFGIRAGEIIAENTKLDLSNSAIVPIYKINFNSGVKISGSGILYELNSLSSIDLNGFNGLNVVRTTSTCGALVVTWNVTSDYNGEDMSCNAACDGELTVTATGTPGPFTYRFTPSGGSTGPSTTNTVYPNLCNGNHAIEVTDSSNVIVPGLLYGTCSANEDISEPPQLNLQIDLVFNPSCHNVCDAQAFVRGLGGTGIPALSWTNGETGQNPVMLCFGLNTVTLTDSNGCTLIDTVEIFSPNKIQFDLAVDGPTCNGDNDASISISNENGGNGGPYTFSYAPAPAVGQNTNSAVGFSAGNITITVSDVDGCPQDSIVSIAEPPIFSASTADPVNIACSSICNGQISAAPNGGVPPYSYEWFDNTTGLTTGITDSIITGLCAGDYFVTITDDNGCVKSSAVVTLTEPPAFTLNTTKVDVACLDSCTGIISVITTGGTPNYTYSWVDISDNSIVGTNPTVTDLCAGEYEITVTDASGCPAEADTVEILNGLPLDIVFTSINPTCYNSCDGEITAVPTNQTGHTYSWSNTATTQTISGLCVQGLYIVEVTSDSGCVEIDTFEFAAPVIYDIVLNQTDLLCFGDNDGNISVDVIAGGNGPAFTYDWIAIANPGDAISGDLTDSIFNLTAQTYEVTITDGPGGCDTTLSFTITTPAEFTATAVDVQDLQCADVCDGQASALPAGGTPPYSYVWFDNNTGLSTGITDSIATGLCQGDYFVTVTDGNNCSVSSGVVSITSPAPLVLTLSAVDLVCIDICDGEANSVVTGGSINYTYSWVNITTSTPAGSTPNLTGLCPGDYELTVVDANNCPALVDTVTVLNALAIDVNLTGIDPTCYDVCDGQIDVTTINSSGFTYVWTPGIIIGQGSITATNLCPDINYVVEVTDLNGCIEKDSLTLNSVPPYDISTTVDDITCFGDGDGMISVIVNSGASGVPYTFSWVSLDGNPFTGQGTSTVSDLLAGDYTLTVADGLGCDTVLTFTINSPLDLLINTADVTQISCFGECDGMISVLPSGGNPGYTYEWIDNATGLVVSNDSIIDNLCAGDYYVRATDSKGCIDSSAIITIVEPPVLTINTSATDISCNGICDGTASVVAFGGTPAFTFTWTSIATNVNLGSSGTITGLCPGEYQVVIIDGTGCVTEPDTVEVFDAPLFDIVITGTDPNCFGVCNGEITGTVVNGLAPFTWSPLPATGQSTAAVNYSSLCEGFYSITAVDNNGCIAQDTVTLSSPLPYDITVTETASPCFGDNSASISTIVNSGGGNGTYTFDWSPAGLAGDGTNTVTNLTPGNYQVTISDGACDTTLVFTVLEPSELVVDAAIISNSLCEGDCSGSGQVSITGGTPNYSILWNDVLMQTTPLISNLCPNTYLVTVVDDNNCTKSDSIEITETDEFTFSVSFADANCFGSCDGSATISAISGGTPNYSVQWNDPNNQTGLQATNLCAGTYQATITDINNCDTIITVIIDEPDAITFTTSVAGEACFGSCNGEVTVNALGGNGPYQYAWFNVNGNVPVGTGPLLSGLCPGSYYAVIGDANACNLSTDTLQVIEFPEIVLASTSITDATCGVSDGAAVVSATGGAGNFTFAWTPGTIVGQGTNSISQLAGGLYQLVVTDNNNCTDSISIPISSGALEVLTMSATDISCFGLADGGADVTFTCLEPNCSVEWFDAGGNILGTTNAISGLSAGTYYLELTNGLGCTVIDSIVVTEPVEINATIASTDILCSGNATGTATVATAIPNLIYNWTPNPSGGQGSNAISGLTAGQWNVEVSDLNGCTLSLSTIVNEPSLISIDNINATDISCAGLIDGTLSVSVSGGTPTLVYEWFECGSGLPAGTGSFVNGLSPGDYFVVITDGNSCTLNSACVTVGDKNPITAINITANASCFGECNGTITTTAFGGDGNYFYQWKDDNQVDILGQTNDTIANLCQGNYYLEVTDGTGCSELFGPIDLTQPAAPWDVSIATTDVSCFASCDGSALITVNAGNTAPYGFSWNDPINQTVANAINLCAGSYEVLITDQVNCDTTVTVLITEPAEILTNAIQTDILCADDCTGEIILAPSGGQSPYGVNWSNGDIGTTASNLCVGPITANIIDADGCTSSAIFNIIEPLNPLSVISTFENISQCNQCNGSATVNITGGTLPYTFLWSEPGVTGQGTNNASGLCSGFISVTVTDANGCEIVESFLITDVDGDAFTLSNTEASCFDICDGTATIVPTCTVPSCTQVWYNAITGTTLSGSGTTITGLCQGDYIVELTNGAGCISGDTFSIASPDELILDAIITDVTCSGDVDGSVVASISGGSGGGYVFAWIPVPPNGDGTNSATGLLSGNIDLTVTDGDNCIIQDSYTIRDTTPIVLTTVSNNVLCNSACDGNITVTASGGYGNYTYQWLDAGVVIPGETNASIFNLCPGSYNVVVTDQNGCSETLVSAITISEPTQVSAIISDTDISCFGLCDGTATVVGSGGQGPYILNWFNSGNNLIGQSTPTATALCADSYYAIITDDHNCSVTTSVTTIIEPTEIVFSIAQTSIVCFDDCNATAQIIISGGEPSYIFEWKDVSSNAVIGVTDSIGNLCAGSYSIEATDQNGCTTGITDVNIISPAEIVIDVFTNNAECNVPSGSAVAQVSGGVPLYSYQWLDQSQTVIAGEVNSSLQGIFAGTYSVVVSDVNSCDDTIQFVIEDNPSTVIQFDAVNNPSCFGANDGSIDITIVGNNLPLNFLWNAGGLVVEDPTNLIAGTYTLTVTDALGCESFYDTVLIDPAPLQETPTVVDPLCGECDGSVSVAISGGLAPYSFNWNNGGTTDNIQNLCGGIYELTIEDDLGCELVVPYSVGNSASVTAESIITPITCFNACDGEITINTLTGVAPFTVTWLADGFNGLTKQNLCAGTYFVDVEDAEGCLFPMAIELENPSEIVAVPTMTLPTCGVNDGEISVTTSGGVLPHVYSWSSPPSNTATISNVGAGVYILTVTDNNGTGCSQDLTFNLSNITVPQVTLTSTDIDCNGNCNGEINSISSGGTPNYSFQWFEDDGTLLVGENNSDISNLCAGTYSIEVTDANGCTAFATEVISEPSAINFNTPFVNNVTCFNDCDGSISVNNFGGTLPYTYSWNDPNSQIGSQASNLCDGTYTLTVTDANNCVITVTDSIVQADELVVTIDAITDARCKETTDGEIQATITGGTPTYTIDWTSSTGLTFSTEDILGALPMDYYLNVVDAKGCVVQDTVTIDTTVIVFVDAGLDTLICFSEEVILNATSNQLAANYTWFNDLMTQVGDTSEYLTGILTDGIYTFIAQATFDGCDDFDTVFVNVNTQLTVDAGEDIEVSILDDGIIGGDPTATEIGQFIWTPSIYLSDTTASNPIVIKPQEDTWYYLEFIDSFGCKAFDSVYVEAIPELTVPEGFSPGSDGKNDTWIIEFNDDFPNLEVSVYNRWGELLFYDNAGYLIPWDGTYKGNDLPVGTYYYVIELNSELYPEPFVGPLTILR